jgi:dihydroflavonol-4-reductase
VLLERGYPLLLLIRGVNENVRALIDLGADHLVCDLFDRSGYRARLGGRAALFHHAAPNTTRTGDAEATLAGTLTLTRELARACIESDVPTMIYTSSVVVLGRSPDPDRLIGLDDRESRPAPPYVRGKLMAEDDLDDQIGRGRLDVRRHYPSWVVGPGNATWTPPHRLICDYLLKPQRFSFSGGISVAHVDRVARGHVAALERVPATGDIFRAAGM